VAAAAAAETVVRSAVEGRITAAARKRLTGPVSAGIGATPALFDAVTGQIPTVTIQAPSTSMCTLRDVSVTASLTGVHRAQGGAAVQGTSADVTLTTQTFTALLSRFATAEVTADPATGDLRIGLGPGGILQADETAALQGDAITFRPASMSLMGRAVPPDLQAAIDGKLTIRRQLSRLPLNLEPRSVAVTGNGVQIHLTAGPATISPGKQGPAHNCASS
jgi:LmeA-like phospholipid-binding